ncbi:MAG: alpha/beta fold hydrolase [Promethearchaeota archaeon]
MTQVKHTDEAHVTANDIEICYDTFGDPSATPLLLISGLGAQMLSYEEPFCQQLAKEGYWIIRFDNRDAGLSTKFDKAGVPNVIEIIQEVEDLQASVETGTIAELVSAPYTLLDMATDAVALLDVLKIDAAHVVGASMGGMIAQTMAIHYPDRVRTLTSIMSAPELIFPEPEALEILLAPPVNDRMEYIENSIKHKHVLHGKFSFDEAYYRKHFERIYDRNYNPDGTTRQLVAIVASGSRKEALKKMKIPTLVIHGDADLLVPLKGGKDTADSIPGAKLKIIGGMGHSLPIEVVPQIIKAISSHAV